MNSIYIIIFLSFCQYISIAQNKYNKVEEFNVYKSNWAMVHKNGKVGFIDQDRNEIVKPRYDIVLDFSEYKSDWAMVRKSKRYGFIDTLGREIVKTKYDYIDFFDDYKSDWAKVSYNKKQGFIDTTGREIVKPVYDKINEFGNIKSNWALVRIKNKWGVIDTTGKEIVKVKYDKINDFDEINCHCLVAKIGDKKIILSETGKEIDEVHHQNDLNDNNTMPQEKFVQKLNEVLTNTKEFNWGSNEKIKVDSVFKLNKDGLLSVCLRYYNDSTFSLVRFEAPIKEIISIDVDVYLILLFKQNAVHVYKSATGVDLLSFSYTTHMIHVGEMGKEFNDSFLEEIRTLYNAIRASDD